jgi:UDP-N-acetylmuramyl pentapeptide phosphotransferase/UDP-N-acetylglucosamine-1-phosphate transferase
MTAQLTERLWVLGSIALVALIISLGLMMLLRPWLARYAMVQPNARSSHLRPTPQGGGIAVVIATLLVASGAILVWPALLENQGGQFLALTAATALLAVVGVMDDMRSLPAAARLAMQCVAVGAVIVALPTELKIVPQLPWSVERAGLFLGGVWFVNLVNFMDGIDWMTVAEVVPVTGAILVLGLVGTLGALPAVVAAALLGAAVGFAPFNRPVAQVFLGDVGSLPIGLLLGWLLLQRIISPRHSSYRSIISPTPPSRLAGASLGAKQYGEPIARISISAPQTKRSPCRRSSPASSPPTWRSPSSR